MALATNSTPGSIILGGDLTGHANAPQLRISGVTPGVYLSPKLVIDAKGRVIYASGSAEDSHVFAGDVTGGATTTELITRITATTAKFPTISVIAKGLVTSVTNNAALVFAGDADGLYNSLVLKSTGVTAGTQEAATLTIDSKGRVTARNGTTYSGPDLFGSWNGTYVNLSLKATGVTAGTYTKATMTVNSKGYVTAASSNTSIEFVGDVSGPTSNLVINTINTTLSTCTWAQMTIRSDGRISSVSSTPTITVAGDVSGTTTNLHVNDIVAPGTFDNPTFTLRSDGRISAISAGTISLPDATYLDLGGVQVNEPGGGAVTSGLTIANGVLTGISDSSTRLGFVRPGATLSLTGDAGLTTNPAVVIMKDTQQQTTKSIFLSSVNKDASFSPDLDAYNVFNIPYQYYPINLTAPTHGADGRTFSMVNTARPVSVTNALPDNDFKIAYNGTTYVAMYNTTTAYSSPDGITWTARTLPAINGSGGNIYHVIWAGTKFVAVGTFNQIFYSADGVTWYVTSDNIGPNNVNLGGVYIASQPGADRLFITTGYGKIWKVVLSSMQVLGYTQPIGLYEAYWWRIGVRGNGQIFVGSYPTPTVSGEYYTFEYVTSSDGGTNWSTVNTAYLPNGSTRLDDVVCDETTGAFLIVTSSAVQPGGTMLYSLAAGSFTNINILLSTAYRPVNGIGIDGRAGMIAVGTVGGGVNTLLELTFPNSYSVSYTIPNMALQFPGVVGSIAVSAIATPAGTYTARTGTTGNVLITNTLTTSQNALTADSTYKFSNALPTTGTYTLECTMVGTNTYCTYY